MASIADLFAKLVLDDSGFEASVVKSAGGAADKASATMGQRVSASLKANASKALVGAGAAVGTFVAGSVQEFAKFEQGMNEVFTLLPGITQDAMGKMSDDVKAFSKETGKLPDEVIPALYSALSAGVPPDNVFEFMRVANKAAVGGVASTTDAIELLSAVTKGYGDTSQEATAKVSDLAFTTVKLGQTTFPELSAAMGKAVPLAAALNIKQEDLFASAATLTGVTGNTAEVMTQLKAVFTSLIKTNPQMAAGLKEMGFESGAAAIEALGLKGTLDGLQTVTGGNTQQLAQMVGSSEALTAVLAITGAQSEKFTANLTEMQGSAGATDVAFKQMDQGIAATTNKILANIKVMAIDVGEQLKDLGPIFTLFGPTAGRAIGAGLGGAFGFIAPKVAMLGGKIGSKLVAVLAEQLGSRVLGNAVSNGLSVGLETAATSAVASPKLSGAMTKAGTLLGGRFGLAFKLAAVVGIAAIAAEIAGPIQDIGKQLHKGLLGDDNPLSDFGAAWQKWRDETPWPLGQKDAPDWASLGGETRAGLNEAVVDPIMEMRVEAGQEAAKVPIAVATALQYGTSEVKQAAQRMVDGVAGVPGATAGALTYGTNEVTQAARMMVSGVGGALGKAAAGARAAGLDITTSLAAGILAKQDAIGSAMDELTNQIKNQEGRQKRIARYIGFLTGSELIGGLDSQRAGVRDAARRSQETVAAELQRLIAGGGKVGREAQNALKAALNSGNPKIREAAREIKRIMETGTKPNTKPAGKAAVTGITSELRAGKGPVGGAAYNLGQTIGQRLLAGLRTLQNTPGGKYAESERRAHGGPVTAGRSYIVGERRAELFVPSVSGRIIPNLDTVAGAGAGAASYTFNVTANGLPIQARTPFEMVTQLRRGVRFGMGRQDRETFHG